MPLSTSDGTSSEERTVQVAFRRAALGQPRQLPLESGPLPNDDLLDRPMQQIIMAEVHRILREHRIEKPAPSNTDLSQRHSGASNGVASNVDDSYVSIVNRYPRDDSSSGRATILVESDWDEPTSTTAWPAAILHIRSALEALGGPIAALDIDIELIASPGTRDIVVHQDVYMKFFERYRAELNDGVRQIINDSPGNADFLESCGPGRLEIRSHSSPWVVCIGIAMDPQSNEADWPPMVHAIESYLQQKAPDINIQVDVCYDDGTISLVMWD